jgi:site-specific recombinase XerD
LYTLTLTDVATGWTECLPLLFRSPEAVQAAIGQARALFPFPILGIDTDNGKEFINETILEYCQREQLTFTRGRPEVKNDQCFVEEKNGAVVRHFVGSERLEGEGAYRQLREVYRALRLYVNGFQPSMKLQAKEVDGERIRRTYDPAKTPLQRLLLSGVLSEAQQEDLRTVALALDPIRLLAHFKELHQTDPAHEACLVPFRATQFLPSPLALKMDQPTEPAIERPSSLPLSQPEEVSEQNPLDWSATTRDPFAGVWSTIRSLVLAHPAWSSGDLFQEIERLFPNRFRPAHLGTLQRRLRLIRAHLLGLMEDPCPHEPIQAPFSLADSHQGARQAFPTEQNASPLEGSPADVTGASSFHQEEENLDAMAQMEQTHPTAGNEPAQADKPARLVQTIEGGILRYLEHLKASGRLPKTLEWHQSALHSFEHYLTEHRHPRLLSHLSRDDVRGWATFLATSPTAAGRLRTSSTIATYLRSVRAFCHWARSEGYVHQRIFASSLLPKVPKKALRLIEPEEFDRLVQACGPNGEDDEPQGWACARNRAILWVLLDTGIRVNELCALRLEDVDREAGTLRIGGNRSRERHLPLSARGWQQLCLSLDQYRCKSTAATPERVGGTFLFLTETYRPLTKNTLTLLFARLRTRTGLPHVAVRPSSLRDTFAVRYLQAGGNLEALRDLLGHKDLATLKRYTRLSAEKSEHESQKAPEEVQPSRSLPARQTKRRRRRRASSTVNRNHQQREGGGPDGSLGKEPIRDTGDDP